MSDTGAANPERRESRGEEPDNAHKRERTLTEKGREYKLELKEKEFNGCVKHVKKAIATVQNLIAQSVDIHVIQTEIAKMVTVTGTLGDIQADMYELLSVERRKELYDRYDYYDRIVFETRQSANVKLKELLSMEEEQLSSRASRASRRSVRSTVSSSKSSVKQRKYELAEAGAAIKVELSFMEKERQLEEKRLQQERLAKELKLQKDLAKNMAKMSICLKAEEEDYFSVEQVVEGLPGEDKRRDMKRFLNDVYSKVDTGKDVPIVGVVSEPQLTTTEIALDPVASIYQRVNMENQDLTVVSSLTPHPILYGRKVTQPVSVSFAVSDYPIAPTNVTTQSHYSTVDQSVMYTTPALSDRPVCCYPNTLPQSLVSSHVHANPVTLSYGVPVYGQAAEMVSTNNVVSESPISTANLMKQIVDSIRLPALKV